MSLWESRGDAGVGGEAQAGKRHTCWVHARRLFGRFADDQVGIIILEKTGGYKVRISVKNVSVSLCVCESVLVFGTEGEGETGKERQGGTGGKGV